MTVQDQFFPRVEEETASPARSHDQTRVVIDPDDGCAHAPFSMPDRNPLPMQERLLPVLVEEEAVTEGFIERKKFMDQRGGHSLGLRKADGGKDVLHDFLERLGKCGGGDPKEKGDDGKAERASG